MTDQTHSVQLKKSPTFKLSMGVMATLGFAQLIGIGSALTVRQGSVREIEVVKYKQAPPIIIREPAPAAKTDPTPSTPLPPKSIADLIKEHNVKPSWQPSQNPGMTTAAPLSSESPLSSMVNGQQYLIKNPRVETLLQEARGAYIQGNMVVAILKAEEALVLDPEEPATHYQLAQVSEDMGLYDKAEAYYLEIFKMGLGAAGPYWKRAAKRLETGVRPVLGKDVALTLAPSHVTVSEDGKNVRVVVPMRAVPDADIIAEHVEVTVHFYDLVKGESTPTKAADNAHIVNKWLGKVIDWNDSDEESLEITYTIPETDEVTRHLFGERRYFGHVVELRYKGTIQDQSATPRRLNNIHGQQNKPKNDLFNPGNFMDELNPDNPLLPPKQPQGAPIEGLPIR